MSRTFILSVALNAWCVAALAQDASEVEPPETPAAPAVVEAPTWSLQLAAEAGLAMRDVELPRDGVLYQIRSGAYPALGVAFQLEHRASPLFSIGVSARYQSSIGLVMDEQLAGGTTHPRDTRSHHFEVGITPSLRWDTTGWAVLGMFGYGIAELDPLNHLVTPSYHLGGPHARVSLQIPLGNPRVHLTLGPEGQITLQTGDELTARGVSASGLGAGANAALDLRFGERWWIALTYRELRFWASSTQGPGFTDNMRALTAQLGGQL